MNLSPLLKQRFFDSNGLPLAGGFMYTYQAGTTTPQTTYSNSTGTTNANPVVLDSSGYADIWIDPTLAYKFVLQDSDNNVQWTVDNVSTPLNVTSWSANTVYSKGQIVQDSSGSGLLYVSLTNSNQNNALTVVGSWAVFGGNIRTVSSNTTLAVTDDLVRSNSTSGNLTHTLPACSTTPNGKRITIKDVGTGGNTTTPKGNGSDNIDGANSYPYPLGQNASLTVENNGTSWDVVFVLPSGSVTQAKLATRPTGTTVAAGGVAISASSGNFSTSSTSLVSVTNLSVTIATTGRPVFIGLVSDGTGAGAPSFIGNAVTTDQVYAVIFNGSTEVSFNSFFGQVPVSSVWHIDTPIAGTYTYAMKAACVSAGFMDVQSSKLIAYEI